MEKPRKGCEKGNIRNPVSHRCKKCESFDLTDLKSYARKLGFAIHPNASGKEICRQFFGSLTNDQISNFDRLIKSGRPIIAPSHQFQFGVTEPSVQAPVHAPRPTAQRERVFVPVINIVETKGRLSQDLRNSLLRPDGPGFKTIDDANKKLIDSLDDVISALDLKETDKYTLAVHVRQKIIPLPPSKAIEALFHFAKDITLLSKVNEDTGVKGVKFDLYVHKLPDPVGRLVMYLDTQERIVRPSEEDVNLDILTKALLGVEIEEKESKRRAAGEEAGSGGFGEGFGGFFFGPKGPEPVSKGGAKLYKFDPLTVSYDEGTKTLQVLNSLGEPVKTYENILGVIIKPTFIYVKVDDTLGLYVGEGYREDLRRSVNLAYELYYFPEDQYVDLAELPRDGGVLAATKHVYFLKYAKSVSVSDYQKFKDSRMFNKAPSFKMFRFQVIAQ